MNAKRILELPSRLDGTFEESLKAVASQEEALLLFRENVSTSSCSGLLEGAWQDFKNAAEQILAAYNPSPETIFCWKVPFRDWVYQDQIASLVIAHLNRGLTTAIGQGTGWRSAISANLVWLSLKVMASGVRPGSKASECKKLIEAGIFFLYHLDVGTKEVLWRAAALHNQISCFDSTKSGGTVSMLPNEAVEVMFQAKRKQMSRLEHHLSMRPGAIASYLDELAGPDHQTYLTLSLVMEKMKAKA